jgi:5-aminolevulinate synthase
VAATKAALREAGLPARVTETHIVPVMVGDPELCKQASDLLLKEYGIYIQPINYPTVSRGTERLRITPTPEHDVRLIGQLTDALVAVWRELDLPLGQYSTREERAQIVAAAG